MIGVSLRTQWFYEPESAPCPMSEMLSLLKELGVESVELRSVYPAHDEEKVKAAADLLWDNGFNITIHCRVYSEEGAVNDVFGKLVPTLRSLRQKNLTITIHPKVGDNVRILRDLSDHCTQNGYPVTIALENNRRLPDATEGDSCKLVLDAVTRADRKNVGICFDMGHLTYYVKKNLYDPESYLLDPDFLSRVVHTHIHGTDGLTTHFPLKESDTFVKKFMDALSYKYFGVYNLELDFPRIEKKNFEPIPSIIQSVNYIKENLRPCAKLYHCIRREFDTKLENALAEVFKTEENVTKMCLLNASSYVFNTSGYLWAIDPAFKNAYILANTPERIADYLRDIKLILITHAHSDHFEKKTVEALSKTDAMWLIPDFLKDNAIEYGIDPQRIITASPGAVVRVGNLMITPFEGAHFRPVTGKGMKEYSYFVAPDNAQTMAFPTDVRNYGIERPEFVPEADCCFAHLWLGDNNEKGDVCLEKSAEFADYMLKFSKKRIFIAHLYENGRKDRQMWRLEHARIGADAIEKKSPDTEVCVLTHGTVKRI